MREAASVPSLSLARLLTVYWRLPCALSEYSGRVTSLSPHSHKTKPILIKGSAGCDGQGEGLPKRRRPESNCGYFAGYGMIDKKGGERWPYLLGLGLNARVMLFAVAVSLLAAVLFAVIPLVRMPLAKMQEGLTDGGRASAGTVWRRFGTNLVVLELAIAVVLLAAVGAAGQEPVPAAACGSGL